MKQRKTTNLGINHSKDKEKYYLMLEKKESMSSGWKR